MSRTPSARTLAAVVAFGALALALGWALALRPAAVLEAMPPVAAAIEAIDPAAALLGLALVLVAVAPTLGLTGRLHADPPRPISSAEPRESPDAALPPGVTPADLEPAGTGATPVFGADLAALCERATDYEAPARERAAAREALLETLRSLAADADAHRTGRDADAAAAAVAAGEWTEDGRAAAFLADEDGPSTPLSAWVVDLLAGADPYHRGLERTLAAIEAIQSDLEVAR